MQAVLHRDAKKYLDRLPAEVRERVKRGIKKLEKEPPEGDIRPYEGVPGMWRTRIGEYRVLYKIENGVILVTYIEPRGQAYTKKTRGKRG